MNLIVSQSVLSNRIHGTNIYVYQERHVIKDVSQAKISRKPWLCVLRRIYKFYNIILQSIDQKYKFKKIVYHYR